MHLLLGALRVLAACKEDKKTTETPPFGGRETKRKAEAQGHVHGTPAGEDVYLLPLQTRLSQGRLPDDKHHLYVQFIKEGKVGPCPGKFTI